MKNNKIEKKLINQFQISLKKIKLKNTKNLYITSNLTSIASIRITKQNKLKIIFKAIKNIMGKNYTIFSPSASMNYVIQINLLIYIKHHLIKWVLWQNF